MGLPEPAPSLDQLTRAQDGAVARRQLRELGISRGTVRSHLRARRWQRVHPRTYVVFTGPLPPLTRIWAALLYAGEEAVASHTTAGWLQDLVDTLPDRMDVCVPHGRRYVGSRTTVRVRQSRHLAQRRHPTSSPPRTRLEDTLLDLSDERTDPGAVIALVLRACQRRMTTAGRIRDRARLRKRLRWRALLADLLAEVRDGVLSTLERRYHRDVERPHGLPSASRNRPEGTRGRRRYRDVRYLLWRLIVELDGRAAHPEEWRERDDVRDNELVETEDARTLRYGWVSVVVTPCRTAGQVGRVLTRRGWPGPVRPCGPGCEAA
ncbi:MAG: hypothetical protein ACRDWY_05715 [Actinomycetes bacterium]